MELLFIIMKRDMYAIDFENTQIIAEEKQRLIILKEG